MKLVMLKKINKEDLLSSIDEKKRQEQQKEEVVGNVVIYDPSPTKVVDVVISKKLAELKRAETEKIKTEEAETEKFKNAVTLTDVQATIKKAGFHPDGSPKVAIAGLFDKIVNFVFGHKRAEYRSRSLNVVLVDIKIDWRKSIYVIVGFSDFLTTKVPPVLESVLAKISGPGPFAILFEVTDGWREVKPDPVILRVINIAGQQFFEPVVGYDMTPLEKSSLVET